MTKSPAFKCVLAVAALLVACTPALAQHVMDGCIFYDNVDGSGNPGNGEVGGCATFDAASLISHFLYNDEVVANPLNDLDSNGIPDAYINPIDNPGEIPDFMPPSTSIALGSNDDVALPVLYDRECPIPVCPGTELPIERITPVCWRGAMVSSDFDPGVNGGNWLEGWTYYNFDGTGRTDLNEGAPKDTLRGKYFEDLTIGPDKAWWLDGKVLIEEGATITILPGTVIRGVPGSVGTLVIKRGARIMAAGTADMPIIFTSGFAPGAMEPGDIGGLVLTGNGISNCAGDDGATTNCSQGDSCIVEGFVPGIEDVYYCGNNDCDDSGVIKYVRVEYSGEEIEPNNELNCFVFAGVGYGTQIEYLQAWRGSDDLFEWFGGACFASHLYGAGGWDDGLDWQMGWRGGVQFAIIQQWADNSSERGIEADNNENDFEALCRSQPIMANLTLIRSTHLDNPGSGMKLRRGTDAQIYNSIVMGWSSWAVDIDNDPTCARGFHPQPPLLPCSSPTSVEDGVTVGRLSVGTFPNPLVNNAQFSFTLPRAAHTLLRVFDPAGRQVASLVDGELAAGQHKVVWNLPNHVGSGTYFYSLTSGGETQTGRLVAVR